MAVYAVKPLDPYRELEIEPGGGGGEPTGPGAWHRVTVSFDGWLAYSRCICYQIGRQFEDVQELMDLSQGTFIAPGIEQLTSPQLNLGGFLAMYLGGGGTHICRAAADFKIWLPEGQQIGGSAQPIGPGSWEGLRGLQDVFARLHERRTYANLAFFKWLATNVVNGSEKLDSKKADGLPIDDETGASSAGPYDTTTAAEDPPESKNPGGIKWQDIVKIILFFLPDNVFGYMARIYGVADRGAV